jgi:hypothetical protein
MLPPPAPRFSSTVRLRKQLPPRCDQSHAAQLPFALEAAEMAHEDQGEAILGAALKIDIRGKRLCEFGN